jgi:undecaprenyl-diphosphatase
MCIINSSNPGIGWLQDFDRELLQTIRSQLDTHAGIFKAVTTLGSDYVLGVVVLLLVVVLYWANKKAELVTAIAVGASAKILEHGLKLIFHRARPEIVGVPGEAVGDYSFPSGHSLNAAAIYGFILVLVWTNVKHPLLKYTITMTGVFLILAVGISRIVVMAHWPSDVIGGWLIGGALVLLTICVLPMVKGQPR